MTGSASDEWDYHSLNEGIAYLEKNIRQVQKLHFQIDPAETQSRIKMLQHTIDFIEYNMRELEITGGNGD
jgi:hypothetical protein